MMKLENMSDLKSDAERLPGASPGARTTNLDANNRKKYEKLGMPYGTANGRLRKSLLFHFVIKLGLDRCFHCNQLIETLSEFSIEHKEPWLNSNNPVEKFFNIENIAFSHLKCNVEAGAKLPKLYPNKNAKYRARHQRLKKSPAYKVALANKRKIKVYSGGFIFSE